MLLAGYWVAAVHGWLVVALALVCHVLRPSWRRQASVAPPVKHSLLETEFRPNTGTYVVMWLNS